MLERGGNQQTMVQYLVYFLSGGTMVAFVAYIGSRSNGMLAAFVASLPILFLLNVLLMYHNGGVGASVEYSKGALLFLPAYAVYVVITMLLLPHLGLPTALFPAVPAYAVPLTLRRIRRHNFSKSIHHPEQQVERHIES